MIDERDRTSLISYSGMSEPRALGLNRLQRQKVTQRLGEGRHVCTCNSITDMERSCFQTSDSARGRQCPSRGRLGTSSGPGRCRGGRCGRLARLHGALSHLRVADI